MFVGRGLAPAVQQNAAISHQIAANTQSVLQRRDQGPALRGGHIKVGGRVKTLPYLHYSVAVRLRSSIGMEMVIFRPWLPFSAVTVPWCRWMISLTMARPMPAPFLL